MQITNKDLRRIIQEELKAVLREEGEEEVPSLTDEDWQKIEGFIKSREQEYYNNAFFFAENGGEEALNKVAEMIYKQHKEAGEPAHIWNKTLFYLLEKSHEYEIVFDVLLKERKVFIASNHLIKSIENLEEKLDFLGGLKNLKSLWIVNSGLKTLPESIGSLTGLRELILNKNELTTLPDSIGNLVNLETLEIDRNRIVKFPESMKNLTKLDELDLWENRNPIPQEEIDKLQQLLPNVTIITKHN